MKQRKDEFGTAQLKRACRSDGEGGGWLWWLTCLRERDREVAAGGNRGEHGMGCKGLHVITWLGVR